MFSDFLCNKVPIPSFYLWPWLNILCIGNISVIVSDGKSCTISSNFCWVLANTRSCIMDIRCYLSSFKMECLESSSHLHVACKKVKNAQQECCLLPVDSKSLSLASVIIYHENVRSFLGTFATESMTWQNEFEFFKTAVIGLMLPRLKEIMLHTDDECT